MKCEVCDGNLQQCPEAGDWFCEQCQMREIEEEFSVCQECGKPLDRENNEYHATWGTCNQYCYGKMVGVYV